MTYTELQELLQLVHDTGHENRREICEGINALATDRDAWRSRVYHMEHVIEQQELEDKIDRICRALHTYNHGHLVVIKGGKDD